MNTNQIIRKLEKKQRQLEKRKNKIDKSFYNGILTKYKYPIVERDLVPVSWRFDLSMQRNPLLIERLGFNAVFNPGAIYFKGYYYLVVRLESVNRKSVFALIKSKTGIDQFSFDRMIQIESDETNRYDMRLTKHEDGYIYGIYCAEYKDTTVNDTSSAIAKAAIVRTKNLHDWERLPDLVSSAQQRNVVLHPEFVKGKYALYTRPQDGFIDIGSGGGIALGYVLDMLNPIIEDEKVIFAKKYHTIYEYKNGEGPAPIKTDRGWLHLAHGVRQTAAGLRYVLYAYATSLEDITKVIAVPQGYLLAPLKQERIGDVSNVLFANGWIENNGHIYLYYAASDTRIHVATTTKERLIDYIFNGYKEVFNAYDTTKQIMDLIHKNEKIGRKK